MDEKIPPPDKKKEAAEAIASPAIPPELAHIYGEKVPTAVLEMYGKLKGKVKREGYLAKLASDEAEKKQKEEARRPKTQSQRQKPKPKRETKPKEEQPIAPLTPMPPEFEERKPEADFIAKQLAAMVAKKSEAEEKVPEPSPVPSMDDSHIRTLQYEPPPAVIRSNRGRPKIETAIPAAPSAPAQEEAQEEVSPNSRLARYRKLEAEEQKKIKERREAKHAAEEADIPPAVFSSNRGRSKIIESKLVLSEEVAASLAGAPEWGEPTLDLYTLANLPEEKMTPAESHSLLGKLIDGYKKTLAGAKEKIGTATKKTKEYITNRNEQLGNTINGWVTGSKETARIQKEKAAALGKYLADKDISLGEKAKALGKGAGENFMRAGEWYRNLPLRDKVGISAVLILGSVATGGAGTFVTLLGAAKLGQRSLASAGVYTLAEGLMEKRISKKEASGAARTKWDTWKKHGTATAASLAVFSGIPGYALKEMFEAAGGESAIELVGGMLGYSSASAPEIGMSPRPGVPSPTVEGHPGHEAPNFVRPGAPLSIAPDGRVPAAMPDFQPNHQPQPSVGSEVAPLAGAESTTASTPEAVAAPGDLAPEPPRPTLEVSVAATPGKGYEYMMKRLWEQLQEKGLDASQYAEGSDMHKLLTATQENIDTVVHQIATDPAHGFFNPDGTSVRIDVGSHMSVGADGNIHLNETVHAPEGTGVTPTYRPEISVDQELARSELMENLQNQADQELASLHQEGATTAPAEVSLTHETITTTEPLPGPDLTEAQDLASQETVEEATPAVDETQSSVPVVERGFISNQFNLRIPVAEAHIYADPGDAHTLVFGGSVAEQAEVIEKHLLANPDSVVYGTDNSKTYLIPYHLVEGKVEAGPPMRTTGVFGFFSTWMKAPSPEDLAKLIK